MPLKIFPDRAVELSHINFPNGNIGSGRNVSARAGWGITGTNFKKIQILSLKYSKNFQNPPKES